jgi:hypothetical protein
MKTICRKFEFIFSDLNVEMTDLHPFGVIEQDIEWIIKVIDWFRNRL